MDGRKKMRKDSKVFRKFHLNLELYTYITKTTKRAGRIGKVALPTRLALHATLRIGV